MDLRTRMQSDPGGFTWQKSKIGLCNLSTTCLCSTFLQDAFRARFYSTFWQQFFTTICSTRLFDTPLQHVFAPPFFFYSATCLYSTFVQNVCGTHLCNTFLQQVCVTHFVSMCCQHVLPACVHNTFVQHVYSTGVFNKSCQHVFTIRLDNTLLQRVFSVCLCNTCATRLFNTSARLYNTSVQHFFSIGL